jgi:hypothetical protein
MRFMRPLLGNMLLKALIATDEGLDGLFMGVYS